MAGKNRGSVSAEAYGEWNKKGSFVAPVIEKNEEQTARLRGCLVKSFLFSHLEKAEMDTVIGAMSEMALQASQRIINQGDSGDCLYVVEKGQLACLIKQPDGSEAVVKHCEASDVFGELALLYNCPRAASVQSVDASVIWRLDRETFNNIVKDGAQKKRAWHEEFLAKVPLLQTMSVQDRSLLLDVMRSEAVADGQEIVKQGEAGKRFFIVEEGEAVATKDGAQVMNYKSGDYFGELALLYSQPREATVTSKGAGRMLSLDIASFLRMLDIEKLKADAKYS